MLQVACCPCCPNRQTPHDKLTHLAEAPWCVLGDLKIPACLTYGRSHAGIEVADARAAFEAATSNGARPVQPPTELRDEATSTSQTVAEVVMYGDVVLRFVSGTYQVHLDGSSSRPCLHASLVGHAAVCCSCIGTLALSLDLPIVQRAVRSAHTTKRHDPGIGLAHGPLLLQAAGSWTPCRVSSKQGPLFGVHVVQGPSTRPGSCRVMRCWQGPFLAGYK